MIRYALPLPSRTELKSEYQRRLPFYERVVDAIRSEVEEGLSAAGLRGTVKCRVKSFDSLYEKLLRKLRDHPEAEVSITDLLGIRIVSPFLSDAEQLERFLEDSFKVLEKERKGVPGDGATFGYTSIHYLCEVPETICRRAYAVSTDVETTMADAESAAVDCDCFEIQVRTILQDAWAEAEHELIYKSEDTPLNEPARRKLAALNASLRLADMVFDEIRDQQRRLRSQLSRRRQDFLERAAGAASDTPPDLLSPDAMVPAGEEIDALLLRGLHFHNARDFENAVATYSEILRRENRPYVRAVVFIHRGMANFARHAYEEAIGDFTDALALDDDNWKALYYRGVIYRSTGRYEEALADLNRCVDLDTFRYESLLVRAGLLLDMGNHAGARRDARAALRLEPESAEARRIAEEAGP